MLMSIEGITVPDWNLATDNVQLRFRPTRNFMPKDSDEMILSSSFITVDCTYDPVTGVLTVPPVTLPTTTDSDIGDNVRWLAEYYSTKTKQKLTVFMVTNFKLAPEIAIDEDDEELGVVTWEAVHAFNRLYKRNNRSGNIDLSAYPTLNQMINIITNMIAASLTNYYTIAEVNTIVTNLYNTLVAMIQQVSLPNNYYTRAQVDTLLTTLIYNLFNGADPNLTTYTKQQIDSMVQGFLTPEEFEAYMLNYMNTTQVQAYINQQIAIALDGYYNAEEVDDIIEDITLDSLADVDVDSPAIGDAPVWNGTAWVNQPMPTQLGAGQGTQTFSTAALDPAAVEDKDVDIAKHAIMRKVVANRPCWVRAYASSAYRAADAGRLIDDDDSGIVGMVFEGIFTADQLTADAIEAAILFNADAPVSQKIYWKIVNTDEINGVVTLTITRMVLE